MPHLLRRLEDQQAERRTGGRATVGGAAQGHEADVGTRA